MRTPPGRVSTRRDVGAVLVATLLILVLLPWGPVAAQETSDEIWQQFQADRPALYNDLAPPFVECFQRRDSAIDPLSPIFHGCLDWHSAVHAAYSHYAVTHRTDDGSLRDAVEEKIAPAGLSLIPAEHLYQQAKGADLPLTENPYGFGWFLVLARERELVTGDDGLREMADYAATMMVEWFETRLAANDAQTYIHDPNHANYSWSLINLDMWAKYTGDEALQAAVQEFSLPLLAPQLDGNCPAERDTAVNRIGFQATCLMRLAAAAHVWGDHLSEWVAERLPADLHVPPVTDPANCHAGGQNFSKAFALHQLHQATGNTDYRDNYVELVRYHVGRPDLYTDPDYLGDPGYLCYSHWVAQFGVRTISLSYEERAATPEVAPPL